MVESIMNDARLSKTVDKKMIWAKEKNRERGLNKLEDLQLACFVNYNIMHILNN
jgi:hypothetical protein